MQRIQQSQYTSASRKSIHIRRRSKAVLRRVFRRLHGRQIEPSARGTRFAATEPAGTGVILRELSVDDPGTVCRSRRRCRRGSEQRLGRVVAPNWHPVAGHLASEPCCGDGNSGGSLGKMTWRRYNDGGDRAGGGRVREARGFGFGRVGFGLRSGETDVPDFGVGNGTRGAPRVHGAWMAMRTSYYYNCFCGEKSKRWWKVLF